MRRWGVAGVVVLALVVGLPAPAVARPGSPSIAALQVALRARGLYAGTVDGFAGPATTRGIRSLQRTAGLAVDGVAGLQTLRALGRRGRPRLGARRLRLGATGFDVAELQFLLAWHGFPSATIDGGFRSPRQAAAIRVPPWAPLGRGGSAA